jgi:predicted ATPase/DNA-binding NarL/FixJ family response regulator
MSGDTGQISAQNKLPLQSTRFVGREEEIREVTDLLCDVECQLLTLVGPGGIGKTRLGIEVAQRLLSEFPDGAYVVSLSPFETVDHIITAIARAINFEFHGKRGLSQQLLRFLQDKQMLLILDSFEHLLDATEPVINIVGAAPKMTILVTSREALNLRSEWVYQVTGMRFPDEADSVEANLDDYGAVQLFAQHARRVQQTFSMEESCACVVQICRLVEGLPLGIELAAGWLRSLSCDDIASEIRRNKDFLATDQPDVSERHRSIRAVFRQSWDMLSSEEQSVYSKLSIFHRGFTQQAAQAVTGTSLLTLSALVDKSLVKTILPGRYTLHQMLRQYAREQLEKTGEIDVTRDSHSKHYLERLAGYEPDLKGRDQVQALNAIALDFENMRRAWKWAVSRRDFDAVNRALAPLSSFCGTRVYYKQGMALFQYAREELAPKSNEEPHLVWARALIYWTEFDVKREQIERALEIAKRENAAIEIAECYTIFGRMASYEGDYATTVNWLQRSLELVQSTGDQFRITRVMLGLGSAYVQLGQHESHLQLTRQALALARQTGDQEGVAEGLTELAEHAFLLGQYEEAEQTCAEVIVLSDEIGHPSLVAWAATTQGLCSLLLGENEQAATLINDGLDISNRLGFPIPIGWAKTALAWIACTHGDHTQGQVLVEEALTLLPDYRPDLKVLASTVLALASIGLEDWATARTHNLYALQNMLAIRIPGPLILGLATGALLIAQNADKVDEKTHVVEMLGLVSNHPAAPQAYLKQSALLIQLKNTLKEALGAQRFDAAWERGEALDLDALAQAMQELLKLPPEDLQAISAIQSANQVLIDPLTERELEILQHISGGSSNREIAERLYVGVSTVKSHINHIYRKLDVQNRAQAIARADELKLVR